MSTENLHTLAGLIRREQDTLYTPNGEVIIGAQKNNGSAAIECWVSDNGAGIPADQLEKVFDKLETDPEKKGGMGLGLAIVRQFVEAHGGQGVG